MQKQPKTQDHVCKTLMSSKIASFVEGARVAAAFLLQAARLASSDLSNDSIAGLDQLDGCQHLAIIALDTAQNIELQLRSREPIQTSNSIERYTHHFLCFVPTF